MAKYAARVSVLGRVVMGDDVEAPDAATARSIIEARFWSDADNLRAELPRMDGADRASAEAMLTSIDKTTEQARLYGAVAIARLSRAA